AMDPGGFLDALRAACRGAGISGGRNWHFGTGGVGNAALVEQYAAEHGLCACVQDMAEYEGERICSTRIREVLAAGDLPLAQAMLGHSFSIAGEVEQGQQLARRLGFPTANMRVHPQAVLPPAGVYEVQTQVDGELCRGIANLGIRPTIDEAQKVVRLETHLLDWQGNLYGRRMQMELLRFLRPEKKFGSVDELRAQIEADVQML
ncbi:MAG: hypothetical protein J6R92_00085, partial [Akkermansia sp.]|nr:hypothetical protein [Akkermansia sp.]